jgi:NAD(P)H-hydrate repair Nnr-like enzyme with NAD(P)H-hydrate dehydratase domain
MIGAFLARGVGALEAAALAAHVHGRAAGRGRAEGLLAGDLPDLVADVLSAAALDRDRDHFEQRS